MIEKKPDFAVCDDCGGQLIVTIWGEGVDSSVGCTNCDNKESYR